MSKVAHSGLGAALAERVQSLSRTNERLRALETYPESGAPAADRRAAAEAVLRRALGALSNRDGFELASRRLAGETGLAAVDLESSLVLQDLAQAGLLTWDVGSGAVQPTALLRELFQIFDEATSES